MKPMKYIAYSLLIFSLFACAGGKNTRASEPSKRPVESSTTELMGIEVIAIRQTAAGSMLDFRFRVNEPTKAMIFFRNDIKPYLIDEKTGKALKVTDTTKVGPMRPTSRDPREGKVYYMFFYNSKKTINIGDKVTVVVGDNRIEHLVVE